VTWQLFIIILPAAAAAADCVQFINVVCFCHHRTSLLCLNTVVIAAGRRLILSANREQRTENKSVYCNAKYRIFQGSEHFSGV